MRRTSGAAVNELLGRPVKGERNRDEVFAMKVLEAMSPARLLPTRATHQILCDATPPDVWSLLREPQRWPEMEPALARVEGAAGHAVEGQRLLGVGRGVPVRIPLDVR